MLNKSGITKSTFVNVNQILANVELQASVGCVVKSTDGVAVGSKKIVKAGTPIKVDLSNLTTPAIKADGTTALNAVVLHDVDVTSGNANATALIFGFVNLNRVESDVKSLITAAVAAEDASPLITFVTV